MQIPLLLFALLGPLPATAFYPTKFRANLSTTPGISHQQMTEEVLTTLAGSLFPPVVKAFEAAHGVPLSRGMLDARTAIVRANAGVDRRPGGEWHYDGADDAASSRILEGLRAGIVKDLAEGRVGWARTNLGAALHLVQDYFAYSDEIEDSDGFEQLWRRVLLSQTTLGHDHSQGFSYDLGERHDESTREDQHHQRRRGQAQQHGSGSDDDWSSESNQHLRAVKWAKLASEAFVDNIAKYVPDRQLQHLFGVGLDSVVLVDPPAFTSPDWDGTREKIISMFRGSAEYSLRKNRANRFSAVSLLSPAPQKLFEWSALEDQHVGDTLDILQDTVLGDQPVCSGIRLESVLSAMNQLIFGGELVLVVGQELQRDDDLEGLIFEFLADHPVAVTIMQLETECGEARTYSLSQNMADLSNGAYITGLDAHQTLAFPRDGSLVAQSGLGVIQINSRYNATSQSNVTFLVDGTMDRLVITADWFAPDTPNPLTSARFYDPDENDLEPVTRVVDGGTHRAVWKIDSPMPGEWGFTFGEGSVPSHNITIKGRSSIQLVDVSFVEVAGIPGREGYFPILQDVLAADTEVGVVGDVYGLFRDEYRSVEWFIVDADTGAEMEMSMTPGLDPASRPGYADQDTFFGVTTLPRGDFYVVVRGVDALGYGFQRSLPWTTSARHYANMTYDIGDADSVAKFLHREQELESEPGPVVMPRGLLRQTVMTGTTGGATGTAAGATGTAPPGPFTSPFGTPVTPIGPPFTNTTTFPGTGATTAGANATAPGSPMLSTGPTSAMSPATTSSLPTLSTSVIAPFPGPSGFNSSAPAATIPASGATNATSQAGATDMAGATMFPPLSAPTSLGLPSSVAGASNGSAMFPPPSAPTSLGLPSGAGGPSSAGGPSGSAMFSSLPAPTSLGLPSSSGGPSGSTMEAGSSAGPATHFSSYYSSLAGSSSSIGNATFTSASAAGETEGPTYVLTKSVTVTVPCHETEAPEGALPAPGVPHSSACAGCKNCGGRTTMIIEQSPVTSSPSVSKESYMTFQVPPAAATDAAHPVPYTETPAAPAPYSPPESPPKPLTAASVPEFITTVEMTSTTQRTIIVPAAAAPTEGGCKACEQGSLPPYGPFPPDSSPTLKSALGPSPLDSTPASKSALGPVYGPADTFSTASSNGTFGGQTAKGHTGHTASSSQGSSSPEETDSADDTSSGEGIEGVRAGAVAVVMVAVGGVVLLIL